MVKLPYLATKMMLLALVLLAVLPNAQSQLLKGRIEEQGQNGETPGLKRSDVNPDPFSSKSDSEGPELLEPPKEAFQIAPPSQPVLPKGFNLSASQNVVQQQPLQSMPGIEAPFAGQTIMPPQQTMPPQQPAQAADPDNSPELQLAWDAWHRRVAEAIYARFNFLAKLAFRFSPPLMCQVTYVVTADGHIQNISVQQKSINTLYDIIVYQTVKSLDGDLNLLRFPYGSRRLFVQKLGTFTQNYGSDGFRYTVGDRETIRQ